MEKCTLVVACKKFFGLHPGQTLTQFQEEVRALTDKDREDFKKWFPSVGYEIIQIV
jgi:hypothetical protein